MSPDSYGLAMLKIKWPDLRGRLDCGFVYSGELRKLVTKYGEAIVYCENLARKGGRGVDLKECELICDELEADIRRTLTVLGSPSRGP